MGNTVGKEEHWDTQRHGWTWRQGGHGDTGNERTEEQGRGETRDRRDTEDRMDKGHVETQRDREEARVTQRQRGHRDAVGTHGTRRTPRHTGTGNAWGKETTRTSSYLSRLEQRPPAPLPGRTHARSWPPPNSGHLQLCSQRPPTLPSSSSITLAPPLKLQFPPPETRSLRNDLIRTTGGN